MPGHKRSTTIWHKSRATGRARGSLGVGLLRGDVAELTGGQDNGHGKRPVVLYRCRVSLQGPEAREGDRHPWRPRVRNVAGKCEDMVAFVGDAKFADRGRRAINIAIRASFH